MKNFLISEVVCAIIFICFLLVIITIGENGYVEYCKLKIQVSKKHSEIQKLALKNYKLKMMINSFRKKEPYLLEKIAREQLMLIKPEEVVYLIQTEE